jgi:hypothetical protein
MLFLYEFPRRALLGTGVVFLALLALLSAGAGAASAAPGIKVTTLIPDYVTAGSGLKVPVVVQNTGHVPLTGDLTVRYTFPAGTSVANPFFPESPAPACQQSGQVDECTLDVTGTPPGRQVRFETATTVEPGVSGPLFGSIEVSGGGATENVTVPWVMTVASIPPFDFKSFDIGFSGGQGFSSSQAASDPAELNTEIVFPSQATVNLNLQAPNFFVTAPAESFKNTVVHVPVGLVGNPTATPVRCSQSQLTTPVVNTEIPQCPLESQIGVVQINGQDIVPLYNVEPPNGSPAEFGFFYQSIVVTLLARLRSSDDGIDIVTTDTPSSIPIPKFTVTIWGVPGDSSHDTLRGVCLQGGLGNDGENCALSNRTRQAFLRMPTSCTGEQLVWGAEVDTYQHPGVYHDTATTTPPVEGCGRVPFEPSFALAPTATATRTTTGLDATLSLPQEAGPDGLAEGDLHTATVALPEGMTLNPSSAGGLQACTDEQLNLGMEGAASCPDASKVGSVTLTTPLLDHPLEGSIFLRTQNSSDPASGELFRIALEIRSDADGVDIKLPGQVRVNPVTGQVTTVFDNLPQLPFSSFRLHFKEGPRALLVTPSQCGTYTTTASFTGWNGKVVESDSNFQIGQGCGAVPFTPSLTAGSESTIAGAFAPLSLRFQRPDGDAQLGTLSSLHLPSGLLADTASVPVRCTEAQARAAACPAASHVGTVTVGAGAGSSPFYASGDVYLMGAFVSGEFRGDPFGLAVVVHAVAGPFDLGNVVTLTGVQVGDDGAIHSQTEPFPTIVKGVPLRLQDVRVGLDRPGFAFNPTSCDPMSMTGTMLSTEALSASLASRFQVGECSSLKFKPSFTVSTVGKTSKASGASLQVHLATHEGPTSTGGGESNIAKVDVQLPVSLPARLTTLQKACTAAQFAADPAGCPEASFVGTAIAHTPILTGSLSGPAILVSHGGEAFPDVVLVLQGEGVRLNLTGHTQIKKGITYSRFETVPDAPVSSFELRLPQGPHSALAANGDLCEQQLVMPTELQAQNGIEMKQNTRIESTGCPTSVLVRSKTVSNRTLKLSVYAPVAGKLSASARGLSSISRSYAAREAQTFTLTQKKGGRLKTTVRVVFTASVGRDRKEQFKTIKVTFKK